MEELEQAPAPERDTLDFTARGAVAFPISLDSPFADGYDIGAERDALSDLVSSERPDRSDPRWSRLVELAERERQLLEFARIQAQQRAPRAPRPVEAPSKA